MTALFTSQQYGYRIDKRWNGNSISNLKIAFLTNEYGISWWQLTFYIIHQGNYSVITQEYFNNVVCNLSINYYRMKLINNDLFVV
jgi:hypothetical protein